jgi:hypothetical protein
MVGGRVDFRVRTGFGEVAIELNPRSPIDAAVREASLRELNHLLSAFRYREPQARRVLLDVFACFNGLHATAVRDQGHDLDYGSPRVDAIATALRSAAQAGTLVVRRRQARDVVFRLESAAAEDDVLGPDSKAETEKTWIALELLGEDGKPISGEPYRIILADGSTREGKLDNAGRAMIRGIDPGQCGVTFPRLDETAWGPA